MYLKNVDAILLINEAIKMKVLLTSNELKDIGNELGFRGKNEKRWTIGDKNFFIKRIKHNKCFRKDLVSAMINTKKEPTLFSREVLIEILQEDKNE